MRHKTAAASYSHQRSHSHSTLINLSVGDRTFVNTLAFAPGIIWDVVRRALEADRSIAARYQLDFILSTLWPESVYPPSARTPLP